MTPRGLAGQGTTDMERDRMSLQPLFAAPVVIQAHVAAAVAAFLLGLWQLGGAKGTARHRLVGWAWAGLMALVVLSSFFIHSIRQVGPFSWIHLLSVLTAVTLPLGLSAARRGRVGAHARAMTMLFLGALLITGAFTFWPGRIMHAVAFGG